MSRYLLISALMLLLFLMFTVMVCKAASQMFNYTATPAIISDKLMTVVMVKDTWFGAFQYCRDNKLGHLLQGSSNGKLFTYIRHQLFLDGWNNTDFLWTGMAKPSSGETFYRAISCTLMPGVQADNATSAEQQCLAVNMMSDNMGIDWFATYCGNKHYFVCIKQKDEAMNDTLTNYVIKDIYPETHVIVTSTPNSSLTDCLERCSTVINRFASVYDVLGSECLHYNMHVHYMPVYVVVEESTPTVNNVVCVKNLSIAIEYYFPDSGHNVTEASGEIVPCTAVETTMSSDTSVGTTIVLYILLFIHVGPADGTTISPSEPQGCAENASQICLCGEQRQISAEELLLKVKLLREDLTVEKTSLSSYKRKRLSAPDGRTSAQVIGVAGASLIAGVVLSILILDLQYLIKFANRLKARF